MQTEAIAGTRPTKRGEQVPPLALASIGLFLAVGMTAAYLGRQEAAPMPAASAAAPSDKPVETRLLRFVDLDSGGIAIFDDGAAEPFEVVPSGGDGFLRGTLRGLARARKLQHEGATRPVALVRTADGKLHLADSVTGRNIYLEAFGPANAAVFERIMKHGRAKP